MSKGYLFLLAITLMILPVKSQAKINIFACEPEWESLVKEIGMDHVKIFLATNAKQDPHYIKARPSLIAKIRKADLLICSGADLESGWLPLLLLKANKNIQPGKTGYFMASDFVDTIGKPISLDRSMGDVHANGNPHIHLNPYNILLVAQELTNRLKNIDPENSYDYQNNYDGFIVKWKRAIDQWEAKAAKLAGIKIISHHKSFSYLFDWLKITEIATLELKPGIAPTSHHLAELLILTKNEKISFIALTPYDPTKISNWMSNKANITTLILPYTVGGNNESYDLFSLFDNMINLMINANKKIK